MLAVSRYNTANSAGLGAIDLEDLLPVIIQASGAVTRAVDEIGNVGVALKESLNKLVQLPQTALAELEPQLGRMAYVTGRQAGKGVGMGLLLPLGLGTALVISGMLLHDYFKPSVEAAGRQRSLPTARITRERGL